MSSANLLAKAGVLITLSLLASSCDGEVDWMHECSTRTEVDVRTCCIKEGFADDSPQGTLQACLHGATVVGPAQDTLDAAVSMCQQAYSGDSTPYQPGSDEWADQMTRIIDLRAACRAGAKGHLDRVRFNEGWEDDALQ